MNCEDVFEGRLKKSQEIKFKIIDGMIRSRDRNIQVNNISAEFTGSDPNQLQKIPNFNVHFCQNICSSSSFALI